MEAEVFADIIRSINYKVIQRNAGSIGDPVHLHKSCDHGGGIDQCGWSGPDMDWLDDNGFFPAPKPWNRK